MVASAPSISFNPAVTSYGVINVGSSCALKTYHVRNKAGSYATAKNVSISYVGSNNASEAKDESWVYVSTGAEAGRITSIDGGKEIEAADVSEAYSNSEVVSTKVIVPAGATTSGQVDFKLHHRYQYTG